MSRDVDLGPHYIRYLRGEDVRDITIEHLLTWHNIDPKKPVTFEVAMLLRAELEKWLHESTSFSYWSWRAAANRDGLT